MNKPSTLTRGSCRCGQVTFEVRALPVITTACHCTGCQKMSASAFSLTALVPAQAFRLTNGEPVIGGLHGESRHFFCPHCLSWMYTRPPGNDDIVAVRSSLLDDAAAYAPFMETWTSEKLPWASTGAVQSYERFPEPQEFPGLAARYAESLTQAG